MKKLLLSSSALLFLISGNIPIENEKNDTSFNTNEMLDCINIDTIPLTV